MKINIRHEAATPENGSDVDQTCVWVVGDDGETVSTAYLVEGEQVGIEVGATASIQTATGEVGPIAPPAAQAPDPAA